MVDTTLPTISDFIPEIVCLGVDCLVCGILYSAYVFTNRAIASVSSAASFDLEKKVKYPAQLMCFRYSTRHLTLINLKYSNNLFSHMNQNYFEMKSTHIQTLLLMQTEKRAFLMRL